MSKLKQPKKQKEIETFENSVADAVAKIQKHRDEILEQFAKAYLAESGLMPSEVEMVSKQEIEEGKMINTVFFRKRGE